MLTEDGLLLRACEHGIAHPVGHLHGPIDFDQQMKRRHSRVPSPGIVSKCDCDGCCEAFGVTYYEPAITAV